MYQFLILLFTTIVAMAPVCASLEDLRVPFSRNDNFVYDYKTALVYNDQPGREFDKGVEQVAQVINRDLGQSMFFNTEFLSNAQRVRQYHIKKKPNKANIGSLKWVNTLDGEQLGATYFDRGSDTLLVVGGGFTNFREQMSPFIDMFPDYDIVLMDFRGHGIYPEKCILNPVQRLFGIRPGVVTFGVQEHRDVLAVVEGFRRAKRASGSG
ncbi:hypothetical protein EBZ39_15635, partial [bacterium]|nr:hypothetical protein [bacterium]